MDLEDLWAVEPSLRSGFYIQPISLLNHIETSKTVSNQYIVVTFLDIIICVEGVYLIRSLLFAGTNFSGFHDSLI